MQGIAYDQVKELSTDAVVELYEAGGWWDGRPESRAIIPSMIAGSFCFLVARDGDRVIGMGRAISDGVSDAYIQDVVVRQEYRGRGIGAEIVRRLAERCTAAGISWVGLVAEPGTRAFYERLGFKALAGEPMLLGS